MSRAFTLLEILLVIAITLVMALLTIPAAVNYFNLQVLDETATNLVTDLRRVRSQAQAGKNDASWGIRQFDTFYVLFEGLSYATRDATEDTTVALDAGMTISGTSEIVFAKITGLPLVAGTLVITRGDDVIPIYVNTFGKIQK